VLLALLLGVASAVAFELAEPVPLDDPRGTSSGAVAAGWLLAALAAGCIFVALARRLVTRLRGDVVRERELAEAYAAAHAEGDGDRNP
jgi:hypothetical protein